MPLFKMKKVWDYCTYNKPFFLLILLIFCIWIYIFESYEDLNLFWAVLIIIFLEILFLGYGMTITRDRINEGIRLPKIMIKDILILGFKSVIVYLVYLGVQGYILYFICSPLGFPNFDLEDLLMDYPNTIHLLFSHNPVDALVFVVLGAILFYITVFFMEIALARLADTGSIISAFDLVGIKRNIDLIGWKHYAKDYTFIVLAIVLFSSLTHIVFPVDILNYAWDVLLFLFMFVTQYWGIGTIYCKFKRKEKIDNS